MTCGTDHCACTYTACSRRGNCCACVAHHQSRGEFPGCFFTPRGERSYDRSLRNLIQDRGGN
ncbi:hypothetical protein C2E25_10860 [Geothermobacter hydrogeniphilus]|uniref:Uncharacterized protein n=1 Tax=Geothermobacter hydrogeniphilus TaxID=1969733 RepID=A0A2K2H930_9BACT|nr:DUF6485 family protein [Geothermobacter hydrogeniphilus]PNU19814.1 hypothetical protein C2E25_10860 [Geothermobacter hydrogeniphilus]